MAINGKILAQGYIPDSKGTLYEVTDTRAYIKFFSLYNGTGGYPEQNIIIYASASMSTAIARVQLQSSESAHIIDKDEALILSTGNKIEGITTTPNTIEYTIIGGTE